MTNYVKKMLHGSLLAGSSVAVAGVLGYVLRAFLTRSLTIEEFGLIYAVIAFFSLFNLLYSLGLGNAIARFVPEFEITNNKQKIATAFISSIAIQSIIVVPLSLLILAAKGPLARSFFQSAAAENMILIGTIYLILSPLSLTQSLFRGLKKIEWFAAFDIIKSIFYAAGTIALVTFLPESQKLNALIITYAAFYGFILISMIWYVVKNKIKIRANLDRKMGIVLLSFSLPLFLSGSIGSFFGRIDVLLLTYFSGLTEVGLYNVVVPTLQGIWKLTTMFSTILFRIWYFK